MFGNNGHNDGGGRAISGGGSSARHAVVTVGTFQRLQGIEGRTVRFELGVAGRNYRLLIIQRSTTLGLGATSDQDGGSSAANNGNAVIVYTGRAVEIIVAVGFRFAQAVIVIVGGLLRGLLLLLQVRRETSGWGCDFLYVC